MKKIVAIFLILILALVLPLVASMGMAKSDEDKIPATDVELVKKVTIKGAQEGKGKPVGLAATGILGDQVAGERYAIVIGISDYPDTGNDLSYADDDANDMYTALIQKYGFKHSNVYLLKDLRASKEAIYSAVNEVKSKVSSDSEVVFFFSGHGAKGKASDGDRETIDEAIVVHDGKQDGMLLYIWDGELKQWFSDFKTSRIIFIFDSCLAGGMTDLKADGRVIAMASTETGLSYEGDAWENGQFTYYFVDQGMLQGFADKYDHDNNSNTKDVTVEEAFDYAKANCIYQTPTISDSFANDLLL